MNPNTPNTVNEEAPAQEKAPVKPLIALTNLATGGLIKLDVANSDADVCDSDGICMIDDTGESTCS